MCRPTNCRFGTDRMTWIAYLKASVFGSNPNLEKKPSIPILMRRSSLNFRFGYFSAIANIWSSSARCSTFTFALLHRQYSKLCKDFAGPLKIYFLPSTLRRCAIRNSISETISEYAPSALPFYRLLVYNWFCTNNPNCYLGKIL